MDALVLAAGYATRLYPLTRDRPKPLLPVGGQPVLGWILDRLALLEDLERVHVVTNHKFAGHFEDWAGAIDFRCPLAVHDDGTLSNDDRLGAVGDMNLVRERAGLRDDLLVVAGDNLFDFELGPLAARSRELEAPVIGLREEQDLSAVKKFGVVDLDEGDRIRELQEKPEQPKSKLFAICLYFFPRATLSMIARYLEQGHDPDAPGNYIAWLVRQTACYGYRCPGAWFDIGDHAALQEADAFFSKRRNPC